MPTTKITKGKSFLRAVTYDLENGANKEDQDKINSLPQTENEVIAEGFRAGKRARLLSTNLIEGDKNELAEQFNGVARQRQGVKSPVHKVSINLKPGEHLETHEWLEVADSYLKEMGYENSPFLIAQHREKDHEHIHIVTSKVDFNGDVVSDSFEKKRARTWANGIEERYNLTITPEKSPQKGLTRVEIEQSIKTKQIPPKLQLQTIISKTLEEYPETLDFVDSLHSQNVSIKIRSNEEKQIIGISFGFEERAFKGSSLGTNFTWGGLQKNGLIYEPERHYAGLEKSIGRTSREEFAGAEIAGGGAQSEHDAPQAVRSDKFSGRGKDKGSEVGIGQNQIGASELSQPTGTDERFVEKSDREVESGNEEKLRWLGQYGRGEIQAAGRIESEIDEEIAAEETFQTAHNWSDLEDEFFREQERIRLLNQPPISNLLSAASESIAEAAVLSGGEALGTGADSPLLAGNGAGDSLSVPFSGVGGISTSEGNLGNTERYNVANDGNARGDFGAHVSVCDNFSLPVSSVRNPVSDGRAREPVHEELEDFSIKFRENLDVAESTARKTLSIEEDLKAEESEKLKIEEQHIEFEMEEVRVLSM